MISVFLPRRTRETFRRLFQVKYGNGFIYFSKPEKQLYPVLNSENGLVPQQSKRLIGKKSTISLGFSVFNNVEKDGENLKKIHFYLPNLSDLKKFMWMIRLKIHVDNPLGWSGVHVDNLDLELWEWRQVVPCGVGWMWRCYTFVMHGCVRWRASGEVETDTALCAFVASSTCPSFLFSSEWREKITRKRQGLFQLSSQRKEIFIKIAYLV